MFNASKLIGSVILVFFVSILSYSQDVKEFYIANDDHTDLFWTADLDTYHNAFLNMLDYYLNLADSTENEKTEHQSRFNCDGTYWIWTYEKNRSADQFQRLINRIQDGHISTPLNQLVVCLGGAPAEAVLRGMYYAGELERKFNLKFDMAVAQENQTLPYGLSSLWAGSGAKYSWKGICNCATQVSDAWDREHEIYWIKGPDQSKILMKWNSQLLDAKCIGGYAEARDPEFSIDYVDTSEAFAKKYPYKIIGLFGRGWDDLETYTDDFVKVSKSKTNLDKKVICSNMDDFFESFDKKYGEVIPEYSACYGNEWDLYCASLAEVSGQVKRSVEKLRGAEALATLVSLANPLFMDSRKNESRETWKNLGLYWEHNWGANGDVPKIERENWQRQLSNQISNYVNSLQNDALSAMGNLIINNGANKRFFVFNQLNWTRTDYADIAYPDTNTVHVVDISSGAEVPSQIVTLNSTRYLRILAEEIPAVGYKVYEIIPGKGSDFSAAGILYNNTMENDFYKLNITGRGAINVFIDKVENKDYAASLGGRAINDLGPGSGIIEEENVGPVSVTYLAKSSEPKQHETRITMIRNSNRIDIENKITENFSDVLTWGFAFNMDNFEMRHEEVGAVIKAKYVEDGGQYSSRNARYDWLTMNHFADLSDAGGRGVTISNADCYFMKYGFSHVLYLDSGTPLIRVLAGGQVDGDIYGIKEQGGDSYFLQRFSLQTHSSYSAPQSMKFALEHQNPLLTSFINSGGFFPESNFSLVNTDNSNILLWSLKPAEEGIDKGIITRFWNLEGTSDKLNVSFNHGELNTVERTTLIETRKSAIGHAGNSFTASFAPSQMQTFQMDYNITPLPVELTTFTAEVKDEMVLLNWRTESEINNYGFEIEKRIDDNKEWKNIAFVKGSGNSNSPKEYSYEDEITGTGNKISYRLKQIDNSGEYEYSAIVTVDIIPRVFALYQNYPNPFNPETTIKFSIPTDLKVKLSVYSILGEKAEELINKKLDAGIHSVKFNSSKYSSGVYLYKLEAGGYIDQKKMVIIK